MGKYGVELSDADAEEMHRRMLAVAMANYIEKPCPVCGKHWNSIQEMIDLDARVTPFPRAAAHAACWEREHAGEGGWYCIGKATRHTAGEVVNKPPYDNPPQDRYEELRTAVFATWDEAAAAAIEAEQYNPVGFVVLKIKSD